MDTISQSGDMQVTNETIWNVARVWMVLPGGLMTEFYATIAPIVV